MKLYKFLPLFLFFSYSASAVPNKEFFVEKCYDNAIKIVNKDFDSYIKDFHPNAEAKEKAKKYLNKMFLKKAAKYDESIKTADYKNEEFIIINEKENNFLFDIEKKVQVGIGFLNIKTGRSHFICEFGLDKDTKEWYKTSI